MLSWLIYLSIFPFIYINGPVASWRSNFVSAPSDTWELVDSMSFTARIPAGEKLYIYFDKNDSLGIVIPSEGLTNLAQQAVERAPDWLKIELADNFSRIGATYQDTYANLILNANDPYVDEIAFEVAHLAPQTLQNTNFNPQVLIENVEFLYKIDSLLHYAQIKDSGSAAQGGNYYSTIKYKIKENGVPAEYELPIYYYYFFVVHPKLHDELPTYINPATGQYASPHTGVFWRSYLFYHADGGYPLLKDAIDTCQTFWNCKLNTEEDNGAIGTLNKWIMQVLPWGTAHSPRIPQPVYTYHWHTGTCSEHTWFTSAVGRTAMIPIVSTSMPRNNHKINNFWERQWIAWEQVMKIIHPNPIDPYDGPGWDGEIRGIYNWRGDGYTWMDTDRYTLVCTLTVNVKDANSNPVDGAYIKLDGPGGALYCPWLGIGYTGNSGKFQFLLGDSISSYSGQISSSIGTDSKSIPGMAIPNAHYIWNVTLIGTMPELPIS